MFEEGQIEAKSTRACQGTAVVKNLPACRRREVCSLGQEALLEEGMAALSSIPAWRIPWTEESGGLQSIGSKRVGHD